LLVGLLHKVSKIETVEVEGGVLVHGRQVLAHELIIVLGIHVTERGKKAEPNISHGIERVNRLIAIAFFRI